MEENMDYIQGKLEGINEMIKILEEVLEKDGISREEIIKTLVKHISRDIDQILGNKTYKEKPKKTTKAPQEDSEPAKSQGKKRNPDIIRDIEETQTDLEKIIKR
jgi:uncharacterized protein YwgA